MKGEVLQPYEDFCGPPLDLLQQVHVCPLLRTPELDAVLQDMGGLLGCERTLPAHVQLFVHQYRRAALNPFIPQPVLIPGIALTQVQDPALGLVEPHEAHIVPLLQLVQVPLDDIPSFWRVNCTTQLGVICKLAEGALNLAVNVIDENIEQHWSQRAAQRAMLQTYLQEKNERGETCQSSTIAFYEIDDSLKVSKSTTSFKLQLARFPENMEKKAHFKNVVLSKLAWCTTASSVTQSEDELAFQLRSADTKCSQNHSRDEGP
ncbi:hypothetical protein QYF61_012845 [Mycteria americana]|uniref:Uncharacterized protein n=1 Tax=Mycteria americana TaxID=33587 RepID=A0AAN7S0Y4_MYCAM|nr:hypothetical protein QYF61_012845 [Mycteria americana]